jgi:hypothetical protein
VQSVPITTKVVSVNPVHGDVYSMQYYEPITLTTVVCNLCMLPMVKFPITNQVCIAVNPVHGDVYSMQYYVKKFVSDLQQGGGFLQVLRFPPSIKLPVRI